MARKARRKPPPRPRPAPGIVPAEADGGLDPAGGAVDAVPAPLPAASRPRPGAVAPPRRSVEMSLGPSRQALRRGPSRVVLDSGDPSIPLDRVPYFRSDLIQVGIVGAAMVVLLVVSALLVIPLVVR